MLCERLPSRFVVPLAADMADVVRKDRRSLFAGGWGRGDCRDRKPEHRYGYRGSVLSHVSSFLPLVA